MSLEDRIKKLEELVDSLQIENHALEIEATQDLSRINNIYVLRKALEAKGYSYGKSYIAHNEGSIWEELWIHADRFTYGFKYEERSKGHHRYISDQEYDEMYTVPLVTELRREVEDLTSELINRNEQYEKLEIESSGKIQHLRFTEVDLSDEIKELESQLVFYKNLYYRANDAITFFHEHPFKAFLIMIKRNFYINWQINGSFYARVLRFREDFTEWYHHKHVSRQAHTESVEDMESTESFTNK
jgi:hypothetical protein